ncbi:hypothetical protein PENTCL1PPCAC_6589 [Pristionchus entomophagus]|uniref:Trichohyalin-like n=1 Tax=Pristionchus entomophagus TaxID=358040 RepID=A0AAV5SVZ4_9BILA|nr:hypothetical protein PENTCL1PPCAC_6589 [Pristionchus entomophagus]
MIFMNSSAESKEMAAHLNATDAANGNELEISKFLLLIWHELCISDIKTIEESITIMDKVDLQATMGDAIKWMNKATEKEDYNRWFHVLFDSPLEEEEGENVGEARTPIDAGDARTPCESADVSIERPGEETFTFTTPSNAPPMRHSFYERDVASMRNSLMVTPRLSARRQLPVPNSEPRHFIAPRHPVSRGSPIAEQLHSPAMREKRREREMRTLQQKLNQAQEERDSKEIEVKEMKKNVNDILESNMQLKSRLDDVKRDLAKESRQREEIEIEMEGLMKEKSNLTERIDHLTTSVQKWTYDCEVARNDSVRSTERINELEKRLSVKSREVVDLKDEVESKRRDLCETREMAERVKKQNEDQTTELNSLNETMNEMKEDWRRRLNEKENELLEIETSNHRSIGEMNGKVMETDAKLKEIMEELDKERRRGEKWKKQNEEEKKILMDEMETEKRRLIDAMREMKEKSDVLEEEREKKDKENGEKIRELTKKLYESEVKNFEIEGCKISLNQKVSAAISNGERLAQEVTDLNSRHEALNRMNEQLKDTIEEMQKERMEKDAVLSRMREVEEKKGQMTDKIERLMKENAEGREKAYSALLENDRFTAIIEKMKKEEEDRRTEEEWNATMLRSEITTANGEKEHVEEKLRIVLKEKEEEKRMNGEKMENMMKTLMKNEEELASLQFIHKNEMKKLKGMEYNLMKMDEIKKNNEEMKDKIEELQKEMENIREDGKVNMENIVGKKKEQEKEIKKKDTIISQLEDELARIRDSREMFGDTSMTTVRKDKRGTMIPQKTLMDFDEEPTQLYSKSNLSSMREEKDYMEVNTTESWRTERMMEDKENDAMYLMTPANDRRQLGPVDSKKRLDEVARRNAMTMPHMRSAYATEEMSPNYSQEALRKGEVCPSSTKKFGTLRSRLGMKK